MTVFDPTRKDKAIDIINKLDEVLALCEVLHMAVENVQPHGSSLQLVQARICSLVEEAVTELRQLEGED